MNEVRITAENSPRLEQLFESLLTEQQRTNLLLERLTKEPVISETLTHEEAAKFLGVKVSTLYNMVHRHSISFYKSGRKNLFKRTDLLEYLEESKQKKREPIEMPNGEKI